MFCGTIEPAPKETSMHPTLSAAVADEHRRDLIRAAALSRTSRPARTRSTATVFPLAVHRWLPALGLKSAAGPQPQPCC